MAASPIEVYVQIGGHDVLAGQLWSHRRRGNESMTFSYEESYIALDGAYAIDPVQLGLYSGQLQTPENREIFGAFSDAAPDTWGRRVIGRRETKRAKAENRAKRRFGEVDYLLGVRDDLRQGALRFKDPGAGEFLATEDTGVPVLTSLPRLLTAAEKLEHDQETDEDLRLLTEAGSSLGGARPKAHVETDKGTLAIAKFPSPKDVDHDVMRWEHVALELARKAGITVPNHTLHELNGRWVLILDRFDRTKDTRIGYTSAMTMLGLHNGAQASYPEIAEVIANHSPQTTDDLHELWRRIAFTVLISNYDDHLRNHGFLRKSSAGWALSPAFDLNPDPSGKRELRTAIDPGDYAASIDLLLSVADFFELNEDQAIAMLSDVSRATACWRQAASEVGLDSELERMEPAFEHEAQEEARAVIGGKVA